MKRTHPMQIGDVVNLLVKEYNLDKPAASHKACWLWGQITGPSINSYTTRRVVKDNVLHVWISSAPLKNELLFQRQKLVEAINCELKTNFLTDIQIH